MIRNGRVFLILSSFIFLIGCIGLVLHYIQIRQHVFRCSGSISVFGESTSSPVLQGQFYITFESDGKGYIRMDGDAFPDSRVAPLHRFIFFDYQWVASSVGDDYTLDKYRIVRAPADASGDEEFLKLVNIISQGAQKLRLRIRKMNAQTSLLSSVNSPLLVCTSQK